MANDKSKLVTKLQAAKEGYHNAHHVRELVQEEERKAFRSYIEQCVSCVMKFPEIYKRLGRTDLAEAFDSLSRAADIVNRYESNASSISSEQPETDLDSLTPAQKAARTRRIRSLKAIHFDKDKARTLREQMGFSRDELAEQLGISTSYISLIEAGTTRIGKESRSKKLKRYLSWYQRNIK